MLNVHEILRDTDISRVSWASADKGVIVMEIKQQWNWEEAIIAVETINTAVLTQQPHSVYTVYIYQMRHTPLFSTGVKLTNLRRLIEMDPPNEQLVIFVRTDGLMRRFIGILSKTYGLRHILKKYHFVATWEEAIATIDNHRAILSASNP